MKKQHLFRIVLTLFAFVLIVISCKKNETFEKKNLLGDAKEWYQQKMAEAKTSFQSNKGVVMDIKQEAQWNDARTYTFEDGRELVGAPLEVTLANGKANGSYMLLISKNDHTYSSLVVYNQKSDYFNGTISASEVQKLYNKAISDTKAKLTTRAVSSEKPKSPMERQEVVDGGSIQICTDWYWTTTIYDDYGNIIEYFETYLYTTCEETNPGNPGGGGQQEPEDCSAAEEAVAGSSASMNLGSSLIEENSTTRKKEYSWKFRQSLLWYFASIETGVHKKVGSTWEWESLTHTRTYLYGTVIGGTLSVTVNSSTATIGTYMAGMTINYDFLGSGACKGSPFIVSRPNVEQSSPVWDSTIN